MNQVNSGSYKICPGLLIDIDGKLVHNNGCNKLVASSEGYCEWCNHMNEATKYYTKKKNKEKKEQERQQKILNQAKLEAQKHWKSLNDEEKGIEIKELEKFLRRTKYLSNMTGWRIPNIKIWEFDGQNLWVGDREECALDLLKEKFFEKLGGDIYWRSHSEKKVSEPVEPKNNKKNKCALKFCAQVIIDKDGRGHSCGYCSLRYCSCCCMSRAQSCQKQLPNKHSHQPSHDNSFDEKGKNQSQPDFTQNKKNISNSDKITINKLLQYFQENNIEQISLTTEGNLEIKYNSTKNTRNSDKPKNIVIISEQEINSKELKEVKNFYQKNNKTSLSQQELNNLFSFSIKTTQEAPRDSKAVWIIGGIGIIITTVLLLKLKKKKQKEH